MADILIVEDDLDLTETYTDWLEANGHSVTCASHIRQAVKLVVEVQPDVITLDLNLPGNSNATIGAFVNAIKTLDQTKIIVISGHPEMISGQSWMDRVDLVLTKPVNNAHLLTMINRLLSSPARSAGYARK